MTAATLKVALINHPLIRRFGFYGFLFFLVKGLLWVLAPMLFYQFM